MKLREYKKYLISHNVIQKMSSGDQKFFIDRINKNKPFNNMSYYIDKYRMSDHEFAIIQKYTILVNNYFKDDDELP
jgi:hypothetical protein